MQSNLTPVDFTINESSRKSKRAMREEAVSMGIDNHSNFYIQHYQTFFMFSVCFGKEILLRLISLHGIKKAFEIITAKEIPETVII